MLNIEQVEYVDQLSDLKQQYMAQTTAALDGMWLTGFVPMAKHYVLREDGQAVGFYCVSGEGYLLQFFVTDACLSRASELLGRVLDDEASPSGKIAGAYVSTAEPHWLSLCLDRFPSHEVNAIMYRLGAEPAAVEDVELKPLDRGQLTRAVEFAVAAIGAPEQWLQGYYGNLIERQELYGVWNIDQLIATGESRGYDEYQTGYADLGVIVGESARGRGLATRVLSQLAVRNTERGLRSICSTERANKAARKAIVRAGFLPIHRIVRFES